MTLVAFKTFAQAPEGTEIPAGVSLSFPWIDERNPTTARAEALRAQGYSVMTEEQYEEYCRSLVPVESVRRVISDAILFGQRLTTEFAAENVLLGITQLNMTGTVLGHLVEVMEAVNAGSLYEAITRIRAVPSESYDATFITAPRLLAFINKIEAYLGLPPSGAL